MKTKLLSLITLTLLLNTCTRVIAQDEDDDESHGIYIQKPKFITVGLVAGANLAQVDGDNYVGYRKIGANLGGIAHIRLYRHLTFSFETLYTQKGAKSDIIRASTTNNTIYALKYGATLNYVEIPLMINYFDRRKSHIGVGISYSRLLNASETLETSEPVGIDLDKYPFHKDNYDLVAGASLRLWKGLFAGFRFQYSLAPIRTASPPGFSRDQRQYSNLWTVRVMYLFL